MKKKAIMLTQVPSGFTVLTGLSCSKLLKLPQLRCAKALRDSSENAEFQAAKVDDGMNSVGISGIRSVLAAAEVMTVKNGTGKSSLNTAAVLNDEGGDLKTISVANDSEVFVDLEGRGLSSVDARRLLKKNLGHEVSLQKATQFKHVKILHITSW
ncbi:MAG: hypothetical protein ACKESB_00525 [Candidatus Hodgkinia cicadicola]